MADNGVSIEMVVREFTDGFAIWAPDDASVSWEPRYDQDAVEFAAAFYDPDGWYRETKDLTVVLIPMTEAGLREAVVWGVRLGSALANSVALHREGDLSLREGIERGILPLKPWEASK